MQRDGERTQPFGSGAGLAENLIRWAPAATDFHGLCHPDCSKDPQAIRASLSRRRLVWPLPQIREASQFASRAGGRLMVPAITMASSCLSGTNLPDRQPKRVPNTSLPSRQAFQERGAYPFQDSRPAQSVTAIASQDYYNTTVPCYTRITQSGVAEAENRSVYTTRNPLLQHGKEDGRGHHRVGIQIASSKNTVGLCACEQEGSSFTDAAVRCWPRSGQHRSMTTKTPISAGFVTHHLHTFGPGCGSDRSKSGRTQKTGASHVLANIRQSAEHLTIL